MLAKLHAWLQPKRDNANEEAKARQTRLGVVLLSIIALVLLGLLWLIASKKPPEHASIHPKKTAVDGVVSRDFDGQQKKAALEAQQTELDALKTRVEQLQKAQEAQKKAQRHAVSKQLEELLNAREANAHQTTPSASSVSEPSAFTPPASLPPMTHTTDAYPMPFHAEGHERAMQAQAHTAPKYPLTIDTVAFYTPPPKRHALPQKPSHRPSTYVPAGTFVRGVLLEGADANAAVNGQSSTAPILVRLLDRGTLPNGHRSRLKGCFVLASLYGDISSERGEARLTTLSCTFKDGRILERRVQGHIAFAGKEGIKGTPVMRNDKILMMAGVSGALSGVGSALQQGLQTQSISPLGVTNTIPPGKVFASGAYGGATTALNQLARYYISRAEQYHPVIEIGPGTVATVIFQHGFSLLDDDASSSKHGSNRDDAGSMNATTPIHTPSQADRAALQLMMKHMPPMRHPHKTPLFTERP